MAIIFQDRRSDGEVYSAVEYDRMLANISDLESRQSSATPPPVNRELAFNYDTVTRVTAGYAYGLKAAMDLKGTTPSSAEISLGLPSIVVVTGAQSFPVRVALQSLDGSLMLIDEDWVISAPPNGQVLITGKELTLQNLARIDEHQFYYFFAGFTTQEGLSWITTDATAVPPTDYLATFNTGFNFVVRGSVN